MDAVAYREEIEPEQEALVLLLRERRNDAEADRIRELFGTCGEPSILEAALQNKVVAIAAHGLLEVLPENDLDPAWKASHEKAQERLTAFFPVLDRLAGRLANSSVAIAIIENGGIARTVQACRGCFASNDVEILVRRGDLERLDRALTDEGFSQNSRERCASEDPKHWDRETRGWSNYAYDLGAAGRFWLNVQWRPILRRWVPMEQALDTEDLLERSIECEPGSALRILATEDNLLVCALHVASHSYVRGIGLRLQLDVDRLVRNRAVGWSHFIELARRHGAEELVFPSLAIPAALLGTPIPEEVLPALVPSERKRRLILDRIAAAGVFNRSGFKFTALDVVRLEIALSKGGLFGGLRRILFPPVEWIKEGYQARGRGRQPVALSYAQRLVDLARRGHA